RRIIAVLPVHHVVEVAALGVPEALIEGCARAVCRRVELVRGLRVASPPLPACEQPLRVIPERIDLYGLSPTRCDDPVVDLCVHPRELVADLALSEQPILGIDTDPEARAAHVMRHDVAQYREQPLERIGVATRPDVPV